MNTSIVDPRLIFEGAAHANKNWLLQRSACDGNRYVQPSADYAWLGFQWGWYYGQLNAKTELKENTDA